MMRSHGVAIYRRFSPDHWDIDLDCTCLLRLNKPPHNFPGIYTITCAHGLRWQWIEEEDHLDVCPVAVQILQV